MRRYTVWTTIFLTGAAVALLSQQSGQDPRLKGAFRLPDKNGWIYVHLQGAPADMGFQHGFLLAPQISEAQKVIALELTHDTKKDWQFFRNAAKDALWPH